GRDINNESSYSDAIAQEIDQEMQHFINYCYDRAKSILTEHKEQLELIAKTLLDVETLDAKQIKSLFEDGILPDPELETREQKEGTDNDGEEDVKVNIHSQEDDIK